MVQQKLPHPSPDHFHFIQIVHRLIGGHINNHQGLYHFRQRLFFQVLFTALPISPTSQTTVVTSPTKANSRVITPSTKARGRKERF